MKCKAFSIIEILIVTFIVVVAFMAIAGLMRQFIVLNYANKNSLIANVLAQQGMELVRAQRDTNWLIGESDFAKYLCHREVNTPTQVGSKAVAILDERYLANFNYRIVLSHKLHTDAQIVSTQGVNEIDGSKVAKKYPDKTRVYLVEEGGHKKYRQSTTPTGEPTIFHRVIETEYRDGGESGQDDDFVYVRSIVYWQDRGADKFYILNGYLTNYSWVY